jgi:PBP1b-binding outer membrane lipoprotein LpoB
MEKTSQSETSCANGAGLAPSFLEKAIGAGAARTWGIPLQLSAGLLSLAILLGGCSSDAPKPAAQVEAKPAKPAVPEEIQAAANTLLGSESQVLVFGDLAKNGKQAFLAANVVPKTPTNNLTGTIVTRAVVVENTDGKWTEVLRCDEYL